jgi:hypothetical protein
MDVSDWSRPTKIGVDSRCKATKWSTVYIGMEYNSIYR